MTTSSASQSKRRTPCVGICSTTYGDLVCRGCKRFAHEITAWNGYDAPQRDQVWQRLNELRDEVTSQWLTIESPTDFEAVSLHAQLDHLSGAEQQHAVLAYLVHQNWALDKAGLACTDEKLAAEEPLAVMQALDGEIYARSKAHYERSFKTPT